MLLKTVQLNGIIHLIVAPWKSETTTTVIRDTPEHLHLVYKWIAADIVTLLEHT